MAAALALMHTAHGFPALQDAALRLALAPPLLQRVAVLLPDAVTFPLRPRWE